MVYEVIGKVVLCIIGTVFFGGIFTAIEDDWEESGSIFFGAWIASIVVFTKLIIPTP